MFVVLFCPVSKGTLNLQPQAPRPVRQASALAFRGSANRRFFRQRRSADQNLHNGKSYMLLSYLVLCPASNLRPIKQTSAYYYATLSPTLPLKQVSTHSAKGQLLTSLTYVCKKLPEPIASKLNRSCDARWITSTFPPPGPGICMMLN